MSTILENNTDDAWKRFILEYGWSTPLHHLATILGRPAEDIDRIRKTGAATKQPRARGFASLFMLWHGREPAETEWPMPRQNHHGYEWLAPEISLLASLVGQFDKSRISEILTQRLREVTGDPSAERTVATVQIRMNRIGMQTKDVLGGITVAAAAREIGSRPIIQNAIEKKQLKTIRQGRLLVIPHDIWTTWKGRRVLPPDGYVQLSSIRLALAIRSDKLSEFARMGYIPGAIRCLPYGASVRSSGKGTWYIRPEIAKQLVMDRRAGRPMPWHGKAMPDNLKKTFDLWQIRKHPEECETCASIWEPDGTPATFDDYLRRYPALAHGAKRHLTRIWTPGLTLPDLARYTGTSLSQVHRAIKNGMLAAHPYQGQNYVTKTDATRWKANHCRAGENGKSWITLSTATSQYQFTKEELLDFISKGKLLSKIGTHQSMPEITYVSRHQCSQLRETIGYTEEEAALKVKVSVERFRQLLAGVNWRKADRIPLVTVQAVIKRKKSRAGYTFEQAATVLGVGIQWIHDRRNDGTIRVLRSKFDERHLYISERMMTRLRQVLKTPTTRYDFGADWLRLSEAATEAGVSTTTLNAWAKNETLVRRRSPRGWFYHRETVRAQARNHWATAKKSDRTILPAWLMEDIETAPQKSCRNVLESQKTLRKPAKTRKTIKEHAIDSAIAALMENDHMIVKLTCGRYLIDGIKSLTEMELLALSAQQRHEKKNALHV